MTQGLRPYRIAKTMTVSAAVAYALEDNIGGLVSFNPSELGIRGDGAVLQHVTVMDEADQGAGMTLVFFGENPTNSTFTNNAAMAINEADSDKIIGTVNVATGDYISLNAQKIACVNNLGIPLALPPNDLLYMAIVSVGTPTYAETDDLTIVLGTLG